MTKTPRQLLLVDSITEATGAGSDTVIVCGSHGGISSARYALQARPGAVVFNDAGVGKDDAGIKALELLQAAGIAACTVAHTSARIGESRSTAEDGVLSHVNAAAVAAGGHPGMNCRDWVARWLSVEE